MHCLLLLLLWQHGLTHLSRPGVQSLVTCCLPQCIVSLCYTCQYHYQYAPTTYKACHTLLIHQILPIDPTTGPPLIGHNFTSSFSWCHTLQWYPHPFPHHHSNSCEPQLTRQQNWSQEATSPTQYYPWRQLDSMALHPHKIQCHLPVKSPVHPHLW